jgi:hypothetical protein
MILIEMTDTFGGEANYSWLDRKEDTKSKSLKQAITRFKKDYGITRRHRITCETGDLRRVDLKGTNVCIMAHWQY